MQTEVKVKGILKQTEASPILLLIVSLMLFVACLSLPRVTVASSVYLSSVKTLNNQTVALTGSFGKKCNRCEIIVDYSKGFKYAYSASQWSPSKLTFRSKDFGGTLKVKVFVQTASGNTKPLPFKITPALKPRNINNKPVAKQKINNKYYYLNRHQDPFGGKGVDQFNLSTHKPVCNKTSDVFHMARIVFDSKRFGDARIESKPVTGCLNCSPLKVRWYHEPTGSVSYQLHVQRRSINGICNNLIRK